MPLRLKRFRYHSVARRRWPGIKIRGDGSYGIICVSERYLRLYPTAKDRDLELREEFPADRWRAVDLR